MSEGLWQEHGRLFKWLISGQGPMAGVSFPGGIFVRSDDPSLPFYSESQSGAPVKDNTSGPNAPDLEIIWMPLLVLENGTKRPPRGVTGISMGAMVMQPSSEGSISLKTASVWDKPIINPNYLADENDMNVRMNFRQRDGDLAPCIICSHGSRCV